MPTHLCRKCKTIDCKPEPQILTSSWLLSPSRSLRHAQNSAGNRLNRHVKALVPHLAHPASPSRSALGNRILHRLRSTNGLCRNVNLCLRLLPCVEGINFAKPVQVGQGRLHIGLNQVAGIQFDFHKVLPWESVVLVPNVGGSSVDLLRDVLDDTEGDLKLLFLRADGDALQCALAVK